MSQEQPRLAELIGSLSLATDLAAGMGYETAVRTCVIATGVGHELGLRGEDLRDVYYTALLRFIGCTAYAHETAWRYGAGDDQAFLRALSPADTTKPAEVLRYAAKGLAPGAGALRRAGAIARVMSDPKAPRQLAAAHCDLATKLAARLGMSGRVVASLGQMYERFDGKGNPAGRGAAQLELPARVLHVAWRAEAQRSLEGEGAALDAVRARGGTELDPDVGAAFLRVAPDLLAQVAEPSAWDHFLDLEPRPWRCIPADAIADVALAFAHYVDVKSPYTLGHSTGVARLAQVAGTRAGLAPDEGARLGVAALLHDLGRVSVPNGIWDKPGKLNPAEWERVRLHPYQTERVLARSPLFERFAGIAGHHHERADGSGYHRGVPGSALARPARILAAADAYQAMTEARAYRPAFVPDEAARTLAAEARTGRLDREAVEHVLAAAGQRAAARVRGEWPAALSEREVEVLCLLARGLSNKRIAERLVISPRTAQHHVEHIFQKTGVSTRAAAAVFAVEHDLLSSVTASEDGPFSP
jgi:HD-GYP domain-containing protein (c-di-GMP phosphodiesterase class II)